VEPLEDRHDLDAGAAVERAGRLVGQDQAGRSTSARAMVHTRVPTLVVVSRV
jgi:hypothetical protein